MKDISTKHKFSKEIGRLKIQDSALQPKINTEFVFRTKACENAYNISVLGMGGLKNLPELAYDKHFKGNDTFITSTAINYTDLCGKGRTPDQIEDSALDICRDLAKKGIVAFVATPTTYNFREVEKTGPKNERKFVQKGIPKEDRKTYIICPDFIALKVGKKNITTKEFATQPSGLKHEDFLNHLLDNKIITEQQMSDTPLFLRLSSRTNMQNAGYFKSNEFKHPGKKVQARSVNEVLTSSCLINVAERLF